MPNKSPVPKTAEHTFESALERLEGIVEEMEGDRIPLEKLLEQYAEGTALLKVCQEKLEAAEKKIEIITRTASGKPQLAPFDPAAQMPTTAAPSSSSISARKSDPPNEEVSLF